MKTIQLYYDYFRHQARTHVDLLHQEAEGQEVFGIIDIEQALGDFRTDIQPKGYMMRLINYTYSIGQRTHEATKELQGGFVIAKQYDPRGDRTLYHAAMSAAEQVTDDIIGKMILDSRAGHPLFDHYFDDKQDIRVSPVLATGDGAYCGWMCIFRTPQFFANCFNPNADRWTDGGQTPVV